MSQVTAQIILTALLLVGALLFSLLGNDSLSVALVGAIAGQGAAVGVRTATNGNGRK